MHVSLLGRHIVYLNTYEVAMDLLESRSAIYSDRVVTEMLKLSVNLPFFPARMPSRNFGVPAKTDAVCEWNGDGEQEEGTTEEKAGCDFFVVIEDKVL